MFIKRLTESLSKKELIGVYLRPEPEHYFMAGWLLDVTEQHFSMLTLTQNGAFQDVVIGDVEDILKFNIAGDYLTRLKKAVTPEVEKSRKEIGFIHADPVKALMVSSDLGEVITIVDDNGEGESGIVIEASEDHIEYHQYSPIGRDEGTYVMPMDAVWRIHLRGEREREIQRNVVRLRK